MRIFVPGSVGMLFLLVGRMRFARSSCRQDDAGFDLVMVVYARSPQRSLGRAGRPVQGYALV